VHFENHYREVKDPCPIRTAGGWQLYGTAVTGPHTFEVLRATSGQLEGPWRIEAPAMLPPGLAGSCLAAPAVTAGEASGEVHMFLQTDYNVLGARIEHLVSGDEGRSFEHRDTALHSLPRSSEAGVYDPHPAVIGGEPYLAYSAFGVVGEPDIHLARSRSGTWEGPWERLGPILRHEQVAFHNARGEEGYEWGLEGGQLLELPDGGVLLNAVCFLKGRPPGTRQRLFLGVAASPLGPFELQGPLPLAPGQRGETGHATATLDEETVAIMLQERAAPSCTWRYALMRIELGALAAGRTSGVQR
jgi:hypothetical protein